MSSSIEISLTAPLIRRLDSEEINPEEINPERDLNKTLSNQLNKWKTCYTDELQTLIDMDNPIITALGEVWYAYWEEEYRELRKRVLSLQAGFSCHVIVVGLLWAMSLWLYFNVSSYNEHNLTIASFVSLAVGTLGVMCLRYRYGNIRFLTRSEVTNEAVDHAAYFAYVFFAYGLLRLGSMLDEFGPYFENDTFATCLDALWLFIILIICHRKLRMAPKYFAWVINFVELLDSVHRDMPTNSSLLHAVAAFNFLAIFMTASTTFILQRNTRPEAAERLFEALDVILLHWPNLAFRAVLGLNGQILNTVFFMVSIIECFRFYVINFVLIKFKKLEQLRIPRIEQSEMRDRFKIVRDDFPRRLLEILLMCVWKINSEVNIKEEEFFIFIKRVLPSDTPEQLVFTFTGSQQLFQSLCILEQRLRCHKESAEPGNNSSDPLLERLTEEERITQHPDCISVATVAIWLTAVRFSVFDEQGRTAV